MIILLVEQNAHEALLRVDRACALQSGRVVRAGVGVGVEVWEVAS